MPRRRNRGRRYHNDRPTPAEPAITAQIIGIIVVQLTFIRRTLAIIKEQLDDLESHRSVTPDVPYHAPPPYSESQFPH